MNMVRSGLAAAALLLSSGAFGQTVASINFDRSFNAASKRVGTEIALVKVGCKPSNPTECEYGAVPDLRIIANGDSNTGEVDELSAYLPRDAMDKARSARSVVTAVTVVSTLIGVFSPSVARGKRGEAVMTLLNGATGPLRRGEIDLGGVSYVLSATQAENLRIYVTR